MSLVQRLAASQRVIRYRQRVTLWAKGRVDVQIRQLRTAIREIRRGRVDVLYLGDSLLVMRSPDDTDRRSIGDMLEDELGDGRRVLTIRGAGYNAALFAEFIRILATLPQRPSVVVFPLSIRIIASTHATRHPRHSYPASLALLRGFKDAAHVPSGIGRRTVVSEAENAEFESLPVTTRWHRADSIGSFRALLEGVGNSQDRDVETQRDLFDYFHGESVRPGDPWLDVLAELGSRLREYGVPVVAYTTPVPVIHGELLFPGQAAEHVDANLSVITDAFRAAAGPEARIARVGALPESDFMDITGCDEHLNQVGRLKVARLIAEQVNAFTDSPSSAPAP